MTPEPASKPAESPRHTFLQLGGMGALGLGILLNIAGVLSLVLSSPPQPPKLLILSIIGLPLIIIGIVMMTIGFTAAARRIRQFSEKAR